MGLVLENRLPETKIHKGSKVLTLTGSIDLIGTIPPIADITKTASDCNQEDFETLFPIEAKKKTFPTSHYTTYPRDVRMCLEPT